jgi:hypothetical protein
LQGGGHSLAAIRRILDGGGVTEPAAATPMAPARIASKLSAELWTRLRLAEGIELHFDATQYNPSVERLNEVREVVLRAMTNGSLHQPQEESDGTP